MPEVIAYPAADPVAEPDAYRRLLLGFLGDDDPARVQGGTTLRLRDLVERAGPRLRDRPSPTDWSVIECIGHMVDGEVILSARYRWILSEDEPDMVGYDQDRWTAALRHRDADPDELLATFAAMRSANLRLWRASGDRDRRRIGRHRERGPESYELMFRLLAGHDRAHLDQADRALRVVAGLTG